MICQEISVIVGLGTASRAQRKEIMLRLPTNLYQNTGGGELEILQQSPVLLEAVHAVKHGEAFLHGAAHCCCAASQPLRSSSRTDRASESAIVGGRSRVPSVPQQAKTTLHLRHDFWNLDFVTIFLAIL